MMFKASTTTRRCKIQSKNDRKSEEIKISMDGRGRALDNIFIERLWRSVKHEGIYLKGYAHMSELMIGLTQYFSFYNNERPHQSLADQTPSRTYQSAQGGVETIT